MALDAAGQRQLDRLEPAQRLEADRSGGGPLRRRRERGLRGGDGRAGQRALQDVGVALEVAAGADVLGRRLAGRHRAGDAADALRPGDGRQRRAGVDQAAQPGQVDALADHLDLDEDGAAAAARLVGEGPLHGRRGLRDRVGAQAAAVEGLDELADDLGRRHRHARRAVEHRGRVGRDVVAGEGRGEGLDARQHGLGRRLGDELAAADGDLVVVDEREHGDLGQAHAPEGEGLGPRQDLVGLAPVGAERRGPRGVAAERGGGVAQPDGRRAHGEQVARDDVAVDGMVRLVDEDDGG